MFQLLSRDEFRNAVFARDGHKCVVCGAPAKDAHHVLERRLWTDGGYYLENGVSVCSEHHLEAERTTLSCEELRRLAGIETFPLPEHLVVDENYDKWGNPILPNGLRMKGELFDDESVQKVLAPVLREFTDRVKYPRTYHLPWSPGRSSDDKVLPDTSIFEGKDVVVTVKMDGENTTMYQDYIHARSIDSRNHPSRNWVKGLHAKIQWEIPHGWRVCGENLYARHSIEYENLPSYFMVFSIWDEKNMCLSWEDTAEWSELLGLDIVDVLYEGPWDEEIVKGLWRGDHQGMEGYVVRLSEPFHYRNFRHCTGKFVRKEHVQTEGHWMHSEVVPNKLRR